MSKTPSKTPGYTEAFSELQQIVGEIESGDITVDDLAQKVKRASELIRICKTKLYKTEADVQSILNELDETKDTR